jgi:hypothetical protein
MTNQDKERYEKTFKMQKKTNFEYKKNMITRNLVADSTTWFKSTYWIYWINEL